MGWNGVGVGQDFLLLRLVVSLLIELLVLSGTRLCYAYHPAVCVEITFEMSLKQTFLTIWSDSHPTNLISAQLLVALLVLSLVGLQTVLIRTCRRLSLTSRDKLACVEVLIWLIIGGTQLLLITAWGPHYFGNDRFLWPRSWSLAAVLAGLNATLAITPVLLRRAKTMAKYEEFKCQR